MAIRRPLIDMLNRGANPTLPHSRMDKRGRMIVDGPKPVPVMTAKKVEEKLVEPKEGKDVLTEEQQVDVVTLEEGEKDLKKPLVKKTDKAPKPS